MICSALINYSDLNYVVTLIVNVIVVSYLVLVIEIYAQVRIM